ncbi:MAG: peptidylprolyl isomerase [Myxococcales bacterium]|nr:peptidylprolyl isomerase [Myxococcales bacterium]
MRPISLVFALSLALAACGGEETPAEPAPAPPPDDEVPAEEVAPPPPAYPNEACARVIVVAWQGAVAAGDGITRSEEEARARAEALRAQIEGGADIAALARTDSDASSSGPRGGLLGTYTRESFPPIHAPIRDAVFDLEVDGLSDVIRAPYGFVVARRCPVEKIHTRHILVRHAGARNAPDDVTRTEAEARARATELRAQVMAEGADFAAIARAESEDSSAEEGGDLGMVGRGLLAQPYEEAAWALDENAISDVVQSEFGFHVIQRLPDLPPP